MFKVQLTSFSHICIKKYISIQIVGMIVLHRRLFRGLKMRPSVVGYEARSPRRLILHVYIDNIYRYIYVYTNIYRQ